MANLLLIAGYISFNMSVSKLNEVKYKYSMYLVISILYTLFKDVLGENTTVARIGGDEFIVVLPSTNLENVNHILNEFNKKLKTEDFVKIGLSASFGL